MSDNPRDTQFAGFAKLLWEELGLAEPAKYWMQAPPAEWNRRRLIVAQRAYDFLLHSAYHSSLLATIEECKGRVALVPDMTAWIVEGVAEPAKKERGGVSDIPGPQTNRAAIIRISKQLMQDCFPQITFDDCDAQRAIREKGVFQALHDALDLPESFVVHFIWAEIMGRLWVVLVESPDLPEQTDGALEYQELQGIYERKEGKARLCELRLNDWTMKL